MFSCFLGLFLWTSAFCFAANHPDSCRDLLPTSAIGRAGLDELSIIQDNGGGIDDNVKTVVNKIFFLFGRN